MASKRTPEPDPPKRRRVVRRVEIDVRQAAHRWLQATDAVERFQAEVNTQRGMILQALEDQGKPDDKGSQWLRFPDDPVDGRILGFQRQRRVTRRLNQERAEAWLRERNLLERCVETQVVLSEEKVLELNWPDPVTGKQIMTDEEQEELYDTSESWALVPQRVKL